MANDSNIAMAALAVVALIAVIGLVFTLENQATGKIIAGQSSSMNANQIDSAAGTYDGKQFQTDYNGKVHSPLQYSSSSEGLKLNGN